MIEYRPGPFARSPWPRVLHRPHGMAAHRLSTPPVAGAFCLLLPCQGECRFATAGRVCPQARPAFIARMEQRRLSGFISRNHRVRLPAAL